MRIRIELFLLVNINVYCQCVFTGKPRRGGFKPFRNFNVEGKLRRKIKIALFPLTCRRRGTVGRSENLFIFRVFFLS